MKGDIKGGFGHAAFKIALTKSHSISFRATGHKSWVGARGSRSTSGTRTSDGLSETGNVANHGSIARSVAGSLRQFVPDVEPITVLTVDALTTDFNINLCNHDVAEPV